jgi:hypothetical protein
VLVATEGNSGEGQNQSLFVQVDRRRSINGHVIVLHAHSQLLDEFDNVSKYVSVFRIIEVDPRRVIFEELVVENPGWIILSLGSGCPTVADKLLRLVVIRQPKVDLVQTVIKVNSLVLEGDLRLAGWVSSEGIGVLQRSFSGGFFCFAKKAFVCERELVLRSSIAFD